VPQRAKKKARDLRYLLRFGGTAFLLISGTLVLVLFVLPQRYVLSSGFRESGISFPTPETPFVPVPAGTFQMGDQFDDGGSEERPVHSVTLTHGFNLGKYEVTQAQWRAVMGTNPAWHVNCEECPVEGASWEMGQQFIAALNAASGRAGCTTESGCYRLPTEAEWEYAAKGGPSGGDGTKWAGSTTVGDVAWYSANSGDATHPVGQKAPNGLGLYDMSGNVWEWVQDWYSSLYYSTSPGTDPGGPATGTGRGTRGGAYHLSAFASRVATRNHGSPTQTGAVDVGFRLVRVQ